MRSDELTAEEFLRFLAPPPTSVSADLASGAAGRIVAIGMALRCFRNGALETALAVEVARCRDILASKPLDAGLFTGLAGIFWALRTFAEDQELSTSIDEYDQLLQRRVSRDATPDVIHGTNGLAIYASSLDSPSLAVACSAAIERLMVHPVSSGVDLGLAHGVAGTIVAAVSLARSHQACFSASFRDHLVGLCRSYISHVEENDLEVGYRAGDRQCGRLAWCYGPLPAALALAGASRYLEDDSMSRLAESIARKAAARPRGKWGVTDYGLCHGITGVAMMFREIERLLGITLSATELAEGEASSNARSSLSGQTAALPPDAHSGADSLLGGTWGVAAWSLGRGQASAGQQWSLPFIGNL